MNKLKELLFLKNIKGVGKAKIYKTFWNVLNELSDLDDFCSELEYKFKIPYNNLEEAKYKAEAIYDSIINSPDIHVITVFDEEYPNQLDVMGNQKPLFLYVKGNLDALSKPNIAFIGTRNPSPLSERFEDDLVRKIVNKTDRVVVSGLALGCDRIAHQATVDEDRITIAILPSGVDVIKPANNKELAMEIIEKGGCLVSEYEPNETAHKHTYVQRDQIVAAFSDATFVVECGIGSGTMHTVDAAFNYYKPIFAYLPDEIPQNSFDGNVDILENKIGSIKVNDADEFVMNSDNLINEYGHHNSKNEENRLEKDVLKSGSKQQTLDFF